MFLKKIFKNIFPDFSQKNPVTNSASVPPLPPGLPEGGVPPLPPGLPEGGVPVCPLGAVPGTVLGVVPGVELVKRSGASAAGVTSGKVVSRAPMPRIAARLGGSGGW